MEIVSVTEETFTLRDVDVNLVGGDTYPLTVWPEDSLTISDDGRIELVSASSGERIVILASAVRWYSIRDREVTMPLAELGPDRRKK